MDGPRGSLVIALLFFISGQLAYIAGALIGGFGFSLAGLVMTVFFFSAVIRLFVELFREGRASAGAEESAQRQKRRQKRQSPEATAPVTPTAMAYPDERNAYGVSHLDPPKRRGAQD